MASTSSWPWGRGVPIGRALRSLTGNPIVFSFQGLLVASVLYSLPFAVQPFAAAFAAVDRNLIETAWCLGASRLRTFARIVVPLARPGIVAGVGPDASRTPWASSVSCSWSAGTFPVSTRTVSISIYDDVQALNYARAGRTAALLLVFSFVVLRRDLPPAASLRATMADRLVARFSSGTRRPSASGPIWSSKPATPA